MRSVSSTWMRSLAACGPARNNETSLIASASWVVPSRQVACIRSGLITSSSAADSRAGNPVSAYSFIRNPTVPRFIP
jgi:hypothetical protein